MKKFLNNIQLVLIGCILILSILLHRQCKSSIDSQNEITRIENNILAYKDSLIISKDNNGNTIGEKRALELKLEELIDTLEFEKNKPPITIIKTVTKIKDSIIKIPVNVNDSTIIIDTSNTWNKSNRRIRVSIPYKFKNGILSVNDANILLDQNIWLEASLLRNPKTKESFIKIKSDYHGVTFNSAQGILIKPEDSGLKDIQFNARKNMGIGLFAGYGYAWGLERPVPMIGIGLYYSPKFLQW